MHARRTHPFLRPRRLVAGALALAAVGSTAGLAHAGAADPASDLSDHGGARRLAGDQSAAVAGAVDDGRARNVILLIGDGMGDSEITVARNYAEGAAGRFAGIDALPLTGQYTTYSLTKDGGPDYVPDSAATGSGWATGTKTYDNAISVDVHGEPQQTLLERAKAAGLKTGDVSTAEIEDATPAVQVAHVSARSCYGPGATSQKCPEAALENGGAGSIAEQLLETRPDVTLGGGAATFEEEAAAGKWMGRTLTEQARDRGYQLVDDAAALDAVDHADQDAPLLGLFSDGNMPTRWVGPEATVGGAKQPAQRCTDNPDHTGSLPTLAQMTGKAIDLLDNPDGFFLQVEGASIDKQDHAANACGQIGETVDLDEAVQVALDYAEEQGNTSVFVTADHAHSSQIIEVGSSSPGLSVTLETADGAPMAVNYGTSPAGGSQQHTGAQLRVAGYGPQAANVVGLTDQTDLFFTISRALGLEDTDGGDDGDDGDDGEDGEGAASSDRARVSAAPGKVRQGGKVHVRGKRFGGDEAVSLVVDGPGRPLEEQVDVAHGRFDVRLMPRKRGSYQVTVTGDDTGVEVTDGFRVR